MDEIDELKRRVKEMTAEAANNETILKKTQARELTLLRADSLAQLLRAMVDGLRESYSLDAISVVLLDPEHEIRHLLLANGERPDEFQQVFFVDSLVGLAPQLTALHKPWLGPFVGADHHLLFPGSSNLKSAALLPLPRKDRATGALCLGSRDPKRFTRHHGTDFLAHLGAVAAVCLENAVNRARLLRAGITDFLTGWHNRRYLQQRLKEELARAQRRGGTIACLMIDIDRFKAVNDGYGHLAGDNALKEVAQRVDTQIRSMDTAARFGGDELAILLPESSAAEAATLAERIREVIAAVPFALTAEVERTLTVSVGVASVSPGRHETDLKAVADRLLADADAALYRAKAMGRNRVQLGAG
ncbi:MAG: two-component system, cell cycle response regulator [Gammaproteobacteria bacterium]|jgi:diguanylate cyclase (GGDEF)-like protein|nr:two-component system, cell cycle response regulator [Gammaproteobacteria bacterium]